MVLKTEIKAYPREDRGGWVIYLPKKLVEDSGFPLKSTDKLIVVINKDRLVISKTK